MRSISIVGYNYFYVKNSLIKKDLTRFLGFSNVYLQKLNDYWRKTSDDVLVCQLAVGSHVDHVLVRRGAELLGRPLLYDIDIPYLFYKPAELAPESAGMKESVHSITETGLKAWQEAIFAYTSQIPTLGDALFPPENARESIQAYWAEREGIRLLQIVTN